jgi:acetyl-CoA synthetase
MRYGEDTLGAVNHERLERVVCAGEVLNPHVWDWLQNTALGGRTPVIDNMWQTETGGPVFGNPYGIELLPTKPGSATLPMPGIDAAVVTLEGEPVGTNEKGIMVLKRPFPGMTPGLWGEPERYATTTGSAFRTSTTRAIRARGCRRLLLVRRPRRRRIKIAAHRLGTIEVESAFLKHPAVAECGVVGRPRRDARGEVIAAFVLLKSGTTVTPASAQRAARHVRRELGPVAVIGD